MRKFVPIILLIAIAFAGCSDTNCREDAEEVGVARSLFDERLSRLFSDTKKLVYSGFGTVATDQTFAIDSLPPSFNDINADAMEVTPTGIHIGLKSCIRASVELVLIYKHMGEPRIELWYGGAQDLSKEILWRGG